MEGHNSCRLVVGRLIYIHMIFLGFDVSNTPHHLSTSFYIDVALGAEEANNIVNTFFDIAVDAYIDGWCMDEVACTTDWRCTCNRLLVPLATHVLYQSVFMQYPSLAM